MNYVVDKVKEEQKEDVSILTHPLFCGFISMTIKLFIHVDSHSLLQRMACRNLELKPTHNSHEGVSVMSGVLLVCRVFCYSVRGSRTLQLWSVSPFNYLGNYSMLQRTL